MSYSLLGGRFDLGDCPVRKSWNQSGFHTVHLRPFSVASAAVMGSSVGTSIMPTIFLGRYGLSSGVFLAIRRYSSSLLSPSGYNPGLSFPSIIRISLGLMTTQSAHLICTLSIASSSSGSSSSLPMPGSLPKRKCVLRGSPG